MVFYVDKGEEENREGECNSKCVHFLNLCCKAEFSHTSVFKIKAVMRQSLKCKWNRIRTKIYFLTIFLVSREENTISQSFLDKCVLGILKTGEVFYDPGYVKL